MDPGQNESISPLAKLKAVQERQKTEAENAIVKAKEEKKGTLKDELVGEKEYNQIRTKKYNDNQARIQELEGDLKMPLAERKRLKAESKIAVEELKKTKEGQDILKAKKDDALKQEIFGDAVESLKEIALAIPEKKKELRILLQEVEQDRNSNEQQKSERRKAFEMKYPEIHQIHQKMGTIKQHQDWRNRELGDVSFLLSGEKFKRFLDDEIIYTPEMYRKVQDVTLEKTLEDLNTKLNLIRGQRHTRDEEIHNKKRGLLESRESFDKKIKALYEQSKSVENELEGGIFYGDNGTQNLRKLQEQIEEKLETYLRVYTNFSSKEQQDLVSQAKTTRGMLEIVKAKIQQEIEKSKLSEEEQLIVDLNDELWRS